MAKAVSAISIKNNIPFHEDDEGNSELFYQYRPFKVKVNFVNYATNGWIIVVAPLSYLGILLYLAHLRKKGCQPRTTLPPKQTLQLVQSGIESDYLMNAMLEAAWAVVVDINR